MRAPPLLLSIVLLAACAKTPPPRFVYFKMGNEQPASDTDLVEVGQAVATLRDDPKLKVAVIGYASSEGTAKNNRVLSLKRAERVREDLIEAGIDPDRIVVAARGEARPISSNETEEGRAKNRRVELFFFRPEKGSLQTQYGVRLEVRATSGD